MPVESTVAEDSKRTDSAGFVIDKGDLKLLLVCCGLALVTLGVYSPVRNYPFINYDDNFYVTESVVVRKGFTAEGVALAVGGVHGSNWHPITTLSHLIDCQLFGLRPGPPHVENVLLHTASVVLLFMLLNGITSRVWLSAIVAAAFGWHPLRVESVTWISERKEVLCTFFFLLMLLAYVRYVRRKFEVRNSKIETNPKSDLRNMRRAAGSRFSSSIYYVLAVMLFALGLMSKPMLVSAPIVLLLVDFWPLKRLQNSERAMTGLRSLVLEKLPFIILSAIACVITFAVRQNAGAMIMSAHSPLSARIANAFISIVRYLGKMVWPAKLAVFYPLPFSWPVSDTACAILLVLLLTIVAIYFCKSHPWLAVGWFWFVVTLIPVLGVIQVGGQAMADRYTYIPSIGICLAVVWEVASWTTVLPRFSRQFAALGAVSLAVLIGITHQQLRYWAGSEALFRHALSCTPDNPLAHYNLGCALAEQRRFDEAVPEFERVLRLDQNIADTHVNLGVALQTKGKSDEATTHFKQAVRLKPGNVAARNNLGLLLAGQGCTNEALVQYEAALQTRPDYPEAHYNLGNLLMQRQDFAGATQHYAAAFGAQPGYAEAHYEMAVACSAMKANAHAVGQYREALRLRPDWIEALNNLAWILATSSADDLRNGKEAVALASHAVELTRTNSAGALDTLAAALAETSRFSEAVTALEMAAALVKSNSETSLAAEIQSHLESYKAGKPWRE